MARKHRSKIKLLIDILDSIDENKDTNLTYISMKANIPHNRLKPIIKSLESRGLIKINKKDNKTMIISLTENGYKLLSDLKAFYRILDQIGLL